VNYTIVDTLSAMRETRSIINNAAEQNVYGGTIRSVSKLGAVIESALRMNEYHARQVYDLFSEVDKAEFQLAYSDTVQLLALDK